MGDPMRTTARHLLFAALLLQGTGCVALLDAAFKETQDHGRNARYENKSYGSHFVDSLFEDDDDCDETYYCNRCCRTTVVVHSCR
jgi:hypothetical protein